MGQDVRSPRGPRCIALVGPFQSGKTTLLEAILARTGAIKNAGSVDAGTSVGDASPEARHHKMGVGLSAATTTFMGDSYTFIDCPGSIEFAHDMRAALPAVDAAVVVCEADEKKLPQLQIILRELEDLGIPRFLFLNKIDRANKRIRETLATLQPASRVPLVLRQIPIWNGELIEGFVDLALERAFVYREHKPSEVVALDGGNLDREKEARFSMLEKLADHDDVLMELLLEDIQPPRDAVFDDLARELREGLICPVLLGAAARENGVLRLMKALRHEAPGVAETAKRLGVPAQKEALAYVFKTLHLQHGGKLSLTRLLAGHLDDGATLQSSSGEAGRVSGILAVSGGHDTKRAAAEAGDTVALGKLEAIKTGDTLSSGKTAPPALVRIEPTPPVLAMSLASTDRKDDVKLGQALLRLNEEDPSLTMIHNPQTHDIVLWGQGEMHLRVALERLKDRFGVNAKSQAPAIGYQETIRKSVTQRGRHKKQSGGHGQFGDVVLEIKPMPRGSGLRIPREGGRRGGAAQLYRRGGGGRGRQSRTRAARLPRHRCARHADGRLLSQRRFLRSRLPHRGADRHERSAAAVPAGAAGADPHGGDRLPDGGDGEDQRHPVGAARPDPGLRHPRELAGMGLRPRHHAGSRDRRPDRGIALGHRRRRRLYAAVRPHGRSHRPRRRPDHRRAPGRGVVNGGTPRPWPAAVVCVWLDTPPGKIN